MAKIKGVCKNIGDECSKALNREVQEVEKSAPFVCEECEKPLMPAGGGGGGTPSTGGGPMKIIILVVILAVLAGGGYFAYTMLAGDKQEQTIALEDPKDDGNNGEDKEKPEDPKANPEPEPDPVPHVVIETGDAATGTGTGTISYHYGKYTGEIKNNKANGTGSLKFYKAYRLSQYDKQERMAESGDVVSGTFKDDNLTNGKWFDKDNTQKGAVLTGELGTPE